MEMNLDQVRQNVEDATTEDLLDRATVYREEMEPAALAIIDAELLARGITLEDVQAHLTSRQDTLAHDDGTVVTCSFCHRPAVRQGRRWQLLFWSIPIFTRQAAWCDLHLPDRHRK
jgi:hypothetical protein